MARQNGRARQRLFRGLVCALCLLCAACASTTDQRRKEFNDDGVHLFSRGDYQGARESFEAALIFAPQDSGLLYNLGQCHDRLGDWRKAEQYYLTCLQVAPRHGDARQAQTTLLYRTGRKQEADRMIQEWLREQPELADAYVLDAWRLRQEKALPQAQGRLQQALALEPKNRRALVEMGIIYEMLGMPERAFSLYERALLVDPQQPDVVSRSEQLRSKGVGRPLPD